MDFHCYETSSFSFIMLAYFTHLRERELLLRTIAMAVSIFFLRQCRTILWWTILYVVGADDWYFTRRELSRRRRHIADTKIEDRSEKTVNPPPPVSGGLEKRHRALFITAGCWDLSDQWKITLSEILLYELNTFTHISLTEYCLQSYMDNHVSWDAHV